MNESKPTFEQKILSRILLLLLSIYFILLGFNSITRTRNFSLDSMEYIDVARHITDGNGIMASNLIHDEDNAGTNPSIPAPAIIHPPFYPICIAALALTGIDHADAALLIAVMACALFFFLARLLASTYYDETTGVLSIGLLLLYYPLDFVSRHAWSETLGIVFIILVLWLPKRFESRAAALTAGLCAGLGFGTRYVLIVLLVPGIILLLFKPGSLKKKAVPVTLFLSGFASVALPLLFHNYLSAGRFFPALNESLASIKENASQALRILFGQYLHIWDPEVEILVFSGTLAVLIVHMLRQKRAGEWLINTLVRNHRFAIPIWTLTYVAALVIIRTMRHFNLISSRLLLPGGVTMILLLTGLLVSTRLISRRGALILTIAVAMFKIAGECRSIVTTPAHQPEIEIEQSERLRWAARNTTVRDLIIGNDTHDIPFHVGRRNTICFSPFPFSDRLRYRNLMDYGEMFCKDFDTVYIILRNRKIGSREQWMRQHGKFVSDIAFGDLDPYPLVTPVAILKDGDVFRVECGQWE